MSGAWSERMLWAAFACLAYLALCLAVAWRHRRAEQSREAALASLHAAPDAAAAWTVAYASQTGQAEQLAWQTAQTLHHFGWPVHLCALDRLGGADLARTRRLLLVLSTAGEGDPPDHAAAFVRDTLSGAPDLRHLHAAVLALGDQAYANYCGFGRLVEGWLQSCGAHMLFDRIEVNRLEEAAIGRWRRQLACVAGTPDVPDWSAPPLTPWVLTERHCLNPGSLGGAVCHLVLRPLDGPLPAWQAGDLVQIALPAVLVERAGKDRVHARDYSIASIPDDGSLQLLVRAARQADGSPGLMSGYLCHHAELGAVLSLRVRTHRGFRIEDNAQRPLILIGNGTGMAGLRAHLKARAAQGGTPPCWLVFGERQRSIDFHHADEVAQWQASGLLARVDAVFSRDQAERLHVQHRLAASADTLRDWVRRGAAIYVCGSLQGMASGVDQVLQEVLGASTLGALMAEGRYRRDLY